MFTKDNLLREIDDLPQDKLEEVYEFVHSLSASPRKITNARKKILSFAGAFSDMSDSDYIDFKKQTKKVRKSLFDRDFDI